VTWAKQIRCIRYPDGKRMFYDISGEMLPVINSLEDYGRQGHTMTLVLSADCIDFSADNVKKE
jgi:hypothetical protein